MERDQRWLKWAVELQSLAQAGLTYGRDAYDRARYERIREISAEILSHMSDLPVGTVRDLFCSETGYQTPKIDTRAAIFQDGKILLVQENDKRWSLPGGWCDVDISVGENTVKEVREESGLEAAAELVIAIQDRAKHNPSPICLWRVQNIRPVLGDRRAVPGEHRNDRIWIFCGKRSSGAGGGKEQRGTAPDVLPGLSRGRGMEDAFRLTLPRDRSGNL